MSRKNILCVGDIHARPEVSNRRATILGRFIKDKQPDIVWLAGDVGDFGSLCSYDKGTLHAEGRRYSKDLECVSDFLHLLHYEIKSMRKFPQLEVAIGNHEDRITRASIMSPELYGSIGLEDIPFEHFGWNVTPFLRPKVLQGITFQHYFTRGQLGRAIDDERTVLRSQHTSCVYGHNHRFQRYCELNGHKKKIFSLGVGCYDEGIHHYTREQERWDRGLVMLYEAQHGYASPAWWDLDYLKRKYLS